MRLTLTIILALLALSYCDSQYLIGKQGQSCNQACYAVGRNCNPRVVTNNSTAIFTQLNITCNTTDNSTNAWWAEDQPSYVSGAGGYYGRCLGFVGVPDAGQCAASYPTVQRLCRCDDPANAPPTFGVGYSNGSITTQEQWIFQHFVDYGDVGVLTHFWATYPANADNGTIVRYYIDGEVNASIQFTPSMASGVGFYDTNAPWGTEWFGRATKNASWFNNFRIPFQKSIVVTVQHQYANYTGFYLNLRGSVNVPITIGGEILPSSAKMNQAIINSTYQPLDYVPLVNVSSGPGAHWMITLAAESGNLNFLQGCVHAYFDGKTEFPGVVIATGTEDYVDSSHSFDGGQSGQFYFPDSGLTHLSQTTNDVTLSVYRFHDKDPLFWNDGFQLVWRNGDMVDPAGMKCNMISGGTIVRTPTATKVNGYAWYYTWPV